MLSYTEFEKFYKSHGFCFGSMSRPKHTWSEKELKAHYDQYLRKEERKKEQKAIKPLKEDFPNPEGPKICQLSSVLHPDEMQALREYAGSLLSILDRAHVFGRGSCPQLRNDPDNIVWLNRYSHNNLDQSRDPISGLQISSEKVIRWWQIIVGEERYARLLQKSKRRK